MRPSATHELKTWPDPYAAILNGRKRFEYRVADRDYAVGDWLILREWNPETETYSGRSCSGEVSYLVRGPAFGVPEGYCVMSLRALTVESPRERFAAGG